MCQLKWHRGIVTKPIIRLYKNGQGQEAPKRKRLVWRIRERQSGRNLAVYVRI